MFLMMFESPKREMGTINSRQETRMRSLLKNEKSWQMK